MSYLFYKDFKVCVKTENFDATSDAIGTAINTRYGADVEAIRILSEIATKLMAGGLTVPGNLSVTGNSNVNGIINAGGGTIGIGPGTGDGASFTIYNGEIRSGYGTAFRDTYSNKTNIVMDHRSGNIMTKGGIHAQGYSSFVNDIVIIDIFGNAVFANGKVRIDSLGNAVFANGNVTIDREGNVSFANDRVKIDREGNVNINGNLTINGYIKFADREDKNQYLAMQNFAIPDRNGTVNSHLMIRHNGIPSSIPNHNNIQFAESNGRGIWFPTLP